MKKFLWVLLPFLLGASGIIHAQTARTKIEEPSAVPLKPQDFDFRNSLLTEGQEAFYSFLIPEEVYRGAVDVDLADLRIFNHDQEIVPHLILLEKIFAPDLLKTEHEQSKVNFFPIEASAAQDLDDISLNIEKDKEGFVLNLKSKGQTKNSSRKVVAYLLDLSRLKDAVASLHFDWDQKNLVSLVKKIRIDGSEDLENWQTVVDEATLARFQQGDQQLERKTISFTPQKFKYLRISWQDETPFDLTQVEAETVSVIALSLGESQKLRIEGQSQDAKQYFFDVGGQFPISQFQIQLPQVNTLVQATLASSSSPQGPWEERYRGSLYRLMIERNEVTNDKFSVETKDRYWKLSLEQKEGGLGKGLPQLILSWRPERLVFLAQGSGPYFLSYGNKDLSLGDLPDIGQFHAVMMDQLKLQKKKFPEAKVEAQQRMRKAPGVIPPPVSNRKYILWAVLIGGVLVLAAMSFKLFKQMNRP